MILAKVARPLPLISVVGVLVGIAIGGFFFYDRFFSGRPELDVRFSNTESQELWYEAIGDLFREEHISVPLPLPIHCELG